jgi:N-acetylglutamate synthase-like GNAT family acetyltransferase
MILIEKAAISDAEEILALQKLAYRSEAELYGDCTIPPMIQTLEEMRSDIKTQTVLKAVSEGRIVGTVRAFVKGNTCCIGRLAVHPDSQNRGIGTGLMNRIESVFNQTGRFELFTGHLSEKNLHLYGKLGYGRFRTEWAHDRLNIVFMEKLEPGMVKD